MSKRIIKSPAIKKIPTKREVTTEKKRISPFKEQAILEKEIKDFINQFKKTVVLHSKRISDFFEMSCYNHVVKFYELNGYILVIENLQAGKYRYKCSTSGIQSNFSNFVVTKTIKRKIVEFEIQHNLAVQSSHTQVIFTTPDISVIKRNGVEISDSYYDTKRRFCFVKNSNMITFFEVKQFNPFPELVFNFIGIINELRKEILTNNAAILLPIHLAPSLMISGKPNKQTQKIKEILEQRYCINIIYDIFNSGSGTFSRSGIAKLRTTGALEIEPTA